MSRSPVHKKPQITEEERRKMEAEASQITTTPSSRSSSSSEANKRQSKRSRKRTKIPSLDKDRRDNLAQGVVQGTSSGKVPEWEHPQERSEGVRKGKKGSRVSTGSKASKGSASKIRARHPQTIPPIGHESSGLVPVPKADQDIAEHYADTIATALDHFGLTGKAKEMIEQGLQGDVVEVNVSQVVEALTRLTASPLQGILEANRVGALGQLYSTAEEVLVSLQENLRDDGLTVKQKLKLLDLVYLRIKTLSGDVGTGVGALGTGLQPGEAEISQTRKVKVNLGTRVGRRKVDRLLEEEERPDDDYLDAY